MELTNNRTLARRAGCSAYSTATVSEAINSFYAFKQFTTTTETIQVIMDGLTKVYTITPTAITPFYTKSAGAGQASLFGINNTLYISDGVDQQAWTGSGPTRNWGIAPYAGPTNTSAYAGTATDITLVPSGSTTDPAGAGATVSIGNIPWSSPGNITANDGTTAICAITYAVSQSDLLQATGFGFNLSSTSTITGIVVQALVRGNSTNGVSDASVQLLKAGSAVGSDLANYNNWTTSFAYQTYGGSTNLWGTAWTYSDINDPGFGVAISAYNESIGGTRVAYVDFIQITVYYTNPAETAWTNVTDMQGAPNASYATCLLQPAGPNLISDFVNLTNYGFSVPNTQTIGGISVQITGHISPGTDPVNVTAYLLQNGNQFGTPKNGIISGVTDSILTLGSSTSQWGPPWVPSLVSNTGFGVALQFTPNTTNETVYIDSVQITVYITGAPIVSLTGTGLTATTGYRYVVAYGNSNTGGVGPASAPSAIVKPSNQAMSIPIAASTDPQVNQIWISRTTDGGATYFALPASPYPNVTTTILDSAPDSALNIFMLADLTGLNTPPPIGISAMTFHMGRVWGAVNNVLYYAVGPDLGNILGNPYEGWPPAYFFTLPSKITKLISTTVGLLVFTISDIYIIYGNASATAAATGVSGLTVFYAAPFITEIGLLSQFAADVNGTTIYMNSADKQTLSIDPSSGVSEFGFPIGAPNIAYLTDPSLQSFDPANSYVTWHVAGSQDKALYVSDGSTGWFRCNTSQAPEGGFVWSPKANITSGCKAVQSIETTPGTRQLLIGPGTGGGFVLYRDLASYTDNGTSYPSNLTMGSIVLAYPGQIAEIDFITCDYNKVGTSPVVSVLLDEINGTFTNISGYVHSDPPSLYGTTLSPATLYANRHDMEQSVGGNAPPPIYCRHLQIKIDFGATDAVKNELLSLTIFGSYLVEK